MTTRTLTALCLLVINLLIPAKSIAGVTSYECVINAAMEAGESGDPVPSQIFGKSEFVVDRITGRIIGGPLDNGGHSFKIFGNGRGGSSFLVITETNSAPEYLRIKEYADLGVKPFIAIDFLGTVYFGRCS